jgi:ribosome biogenesis SPOUT family RNA methylase Rps3
VLRAHDFPSRHLGNKDMTTDNAAIFSKMILDGKTFEDIPTQDHPNIRLGKYESVELPFRFVLKNDKITLAPGMVEHLRSLNDQPLN